MTQVFQCAVTVRAIHATSSEHRLWTTTAIEGYDTGEANEFSASPATTMASENTTMGQIFIVGETFAAAHAHGGTLSRQPLLDHTPLGQALQDLYRPLAGELRASP